MAKVNKFLFIIDNNFYVKNQSILDTMLQNFIPDYALELFNANKLNKSLNGAEILYKLCNHHNIKRDSALIAIGGGTICDLVGFVSATYMRGVAMVNVPTTLMSSTDPIVGKVAVNYISRKNLIGAWLYPALTIIDPKLIKKDSVRYFNTGIAEIIKAVFLKNKQSVDKLAIDMKKLLRMNNEIIQKYIKLSIGIKIKYVLKDEQDIYSQHAKLGLGHELADVIEMLYPIKLITHGEAVALGMIFSATINNIIEHTRLSQELLKKTIYLINAAKLPVQLPADIKYKKIIYGLLNSKKSYNNTISLVLVKNYGKTEIKTRLENDIIKKAFLTLRS